MSFFESCISGCGIWEQKSIELCPWGKDKIQITSDTPWKPIMSDLGGPRMAPEISYMAIMGKRIGQTCFEIKIPGGTHQGGPKTAPRRVKMTTIRPQDSCQDAPRCPEEAPRCPKTLQDAPKTPLDAPNDAIKTPRALGVPHC